MGCWFIRSYLFAVTKILEDFIVLNKRFTQSTMMITLNDTEYIPGFPKSFKTIDVM